jgi:UDP-galactopyranose mutase
MKYGVIIAGSGFAGSTAAYKAAERGLRVLMFEKRTHLAGNAYDYVADSGILVHKYGPHVINANEERVIKFLEDLWTWDRFILRGRSVIDGKQTPCPFNFKTIDDFYPKSEADALKERLKNHYGDSGKVTIVDMLECGDAAIKGYANFLFEKDYRPYTAKMWGIQPEGIDANVLKRVPVRLSYDDRCTDGAWQALPRGGFTAFWGKLLGSPNIDVEINSDILPHLEFTGDGKILFDGDVLDIPLIYTGPLDELFGCRYGRLPYRSLRIDFQTLPTPSFQETPIVVHPEAEGYTRITEYSKITSRVEVHEKTIISIEYPTRYDHEINEPYYPILTGDSGKTACRYRHLARKYPMLRLCGRLAGFRYLNIEEAISSALDIFDELFPL